MISGIWSNKRFVLPFNFAEVVNAESRNNFFSRKYKVQLQAFVKTSYKYIFYSSSLRETYSFFNFLSHGSFKK